MDKKIQHINRDIIFRNPVDAFNNAIETGFLSANETDKDFAGNFMYMDSYHDDQSNLWIDEFKHVVTRKYRRIINENPPA